MGCGRDGTADDIDDIDVMSGIDRKDVADGRDGMVDGMVGTDDTRIVDGLFGIDHKDAWTAWRDGAKLV